MVQQLSNWFQRRFVNTDLGILIFSIIIIALIIWLLGELLTPVLVSIVLAYLLDGLVKRITRWKIPHTLAVTIVCLFFLGLFLLALFVLMPLVWDQLLTLLNEIPMRVKQGEAYFTELSQRYPAYVSKEQTQKVVQTFQSDFARLGRVALSFSISTITSIVILIVYFVLVPLMVFFFLKDRDAILSWSADFLPKKRKLLREVWSEVNEQIGNYIRTKVLEIVIIGLVSTLMFALLGLNYSILLGVLVGLSALIPYVGVIVATIPVVIVAYLQWGLNIDFLYVMIAYSILMIVDGNILTPLLFSETLKLHPVAVIIAVLIFGGLWGFWGIFFAIPLASVVKAVINAWFRVENPHTG